MIQVSYDLEFDYTALGSGSFPSLWVTLSAPDRSKAIQTLGLLDSGAERSLFDGRLAAGIGMDVLSGPKLTYQTTTAVVTEARLLMVWIAHESLGDFQLEVGFSSTELRRNLLGRDFFNLVQIGFRERQLRFYLTPKP